MFFIVTFSKTVSRAPRQLICPPRDASAFSSRLCWAAPVLPVLRKSLTVSAFCLCGRFGSLPCESVGFSVLVSEHSCGRWKGLHSVRGLLASTVWQEGSSPSPSHSSRPSAVFFSDCGGGFVSGCRQSDSVWHFLDAVL